VHSVITHSEALVDERLANRLDCCDSIWVDCLGNFRTWLRLVTVIMLLVLASLNCHCSQQHCVMQFLLLSTSTASTTANTAAITFATASYTGLERRVVTRH
jgi:hypothetical protein